MRKILFILLLLPFAGFGQAGHWRYIDGYGMTILKGATTSDTIAHFTGDKLFDHFGKVRLRDTARLDARINYHTNLHGSFTAYSLIDKAYLDSVLSTLGGGGITSINSQTGPAIILDEGTAGTDFSITQSTNTIFFNLPSSSASNRGLLTAADWSTFNGKLANITGLVTQGTNVTITGTGTSGDPYVVNSSGGGGGGDFSSNTSSSVDNEIVLFDGTGGKTGKRATQTGVLIGTSGVLSGVTTSSGISSAISDEVGGGGALVFNLSPTFSTSIISPIVHGSTTASGTLQLSSTSNGTKGAINFGSSSYNEASNTLTLAGNIAYTSGGSFDIGSTGTRLRQLYVNGLNINSSSARADNTINVIPGFTVTNGTTPAATGTNNLFTFSSAASAATAGTTNFILWGTSGFAPTSGTAIFNQHRFAHTINQTGGANGVTRTLFIDPTITAAANYFAIATTQGKVQFNALPTVTTADSLVAYEDGELKKVLTASLIASGSYSPTVTSSTNSQAASVTSGSLNYERIGSHVRVWGMMDVDASVINTQTEFFITLPIASALANDYNLIGFIANSGLLTTGIATAGVIVADATNDRALVSFTSQSTSSLSYNISFTYQIL